MSDRLDVSKIRSPGVVVVRVGVVAVVLVPLAVLATSRGLVVATPENSSA